MIIKLPLDPLLDTIQIYYGNVALIGENLSPHDAYSKFEKQVSQRIAKQISTRFQHQKNLLINMTWFGPQFNFKSWQQLLEFEQKNIIFDNLFFLATVDPPYLNVVELQEVKNKIQALSVYYLGNFDSPHSFNFFAPILSDNFKIYTNEELKLKNIKYIFCNYNRKPKLHRVEFVKKLLANKLDKFGIVTLGKDETNDLYLTIGERQEDYVGTTVSHYGLPMDYYSLHNMDVWTHTFLYINAATEFNPMDNLFCQQDTFKPMIGLRPFVINGVQKTYRWLRLNGFKTFNHYWPHIDIENGDPHKTIIELLHWLKTQDLPAMYNNMLPLLQYNKKRFFEFAEEQKYKIDHLFE